MCDFLRITHCVKSHNSLRGVFLDTLYVNIFLFTENNLECSRISKLTKEQLIQKLMRLKEVGSGELINLLYKIKDA